MAERYQIRIEAERFIHNDLSSCAWYFQKRTRKKIENNDTDGVYFDMMSSLIFSAFSIEAKVNFVGWKVFQNAWPERANLREKLELLNHTLKLALERGARPYQNILQLKKLRDTLAHGKPEIVNKEMVTDAEPDVWAALKSQWEQDVTPDFVDRCREDEDVLWKLMLECGGIELHETLTHGGHSLSKIREDDS